MARLVAVDTDLVIDFLRGTGPGVVVVRDGLQNGTLRLSAITGFELRVGTSFLDRRDDIVRLFRSRTLPLDLRSALRAGEVHAALAADGATIGFADALQAGICLRHEIALATRNRRHFERVEGLELVSLT